MNTKNATNQPHINNMGATSLYFALKLGVKFMVIEPAKQRKATTVKKIINATIMLFFYHCL